MIYWHSGKKMLKKKMSGDGGYGIHKRIKSLVEKHHSNLHQELNLPKSVRMFLSCDDSNQTMLVDIHVSSESPIYDLGDLPEEISLEIYQYYKRLDYINIFFIFKIPTDYPFKPPRLIHKTYSTTAKNKYIKTFIDFVVKDVNIMNGVKNIDKEYRYHDPQYFSPATDMEKEILSLFSKLLPMYEYFNLIPNQSLIHDTNLFQVCQNRLEQDINVYPEISRKIIGKRTRLCRQCRYRNRQRVLPRARSCECSRRRIESNQQVWDTN